MPFDRFLIAPLTLGQQQDVKPWLILDTAFERLRNAYTWRSTIKKRFGGRVMNGSKVSVEQQLFTRLRINVGTTDGNGDFPATVMPGAAGTGKIGQMFSIGSTIFTVYQSGIMYTTGVATGTYVTATRTVTITGNGENPATDVYFYPSEPVMNLSTYNLTDVSNEQLIAFDTQFAYTFTYINGWDILGGVPPAAGSAIWTDFNNKRNFHWTANYRGAAQSDFLLFVTNYLSADGIKTWEGAPTNTWTTLSNAVLATGAVAANDHIETCKVILPFKNCLFFFNTIETVGGAANQSFVNRVRYSQFGAANIVDAWRSDITGKGGFIELEENEAIMSAGYIKDRLIVFCEASTFELVFTGNFADPFRFQKLNTELGVESTHSIISFDKVLLGIGENGIHACNGMNVEPIDDLIPNEVFSITNLNNGPQRVQGIRDFWTDQVYWAYNSNSAQEGGYNETYPNRVLVYNYKEGTWSFNDDSITSFGYFQYQKDLTWEDIDSAWQDMDESWKDATTQYRFKNIVAGNQEGFTFIVDSEENKNAQALMITNITYAAYTATLTIIDHNLAYNEVIYIRNIVSTLTLGTVLNDRSYLVTPVDVNTVTIVPDAVPTGVYQGGGTCRRVSQIDILTKQYNFYTKSGANTLINEVDFYVDKTENGEITVDYFVSSSNRSMIADSIDQFTGNASGLGELVLETSPYAIVPFEDSQDRFWHRLYFIAEGENIQLRLYLTPDQLMDTDIADSGFELNAMLFYAKQTRQL